MRLWSLRYLATHCGDRSVSVNVTPDGRADAVKPCAEAAGARVFVKPEERRMPLRDLVAALEDPNGPAAAGLNGGVPYLSRQNDSLRQEFASVAGDVPLQGPAFAREALGGSSAGEPDAVNLWIGDARSLTTAHADPYENVYCVLRGAKRFTLWPPTDAPLLRERPFRTGTHRWEPDTATAAATAAAASDGAGGAESRCSKDSDGDGGGRWVVDLDDAALTDRGGEACRVSCSGCDACRGCAVNWVDGAGERRGEPFHSTTSSLGGRETESGSGGGGGGGGGGERAVPLVVEVAAGETLYLPALWYHQVETVGLLPPQSPPQQPQ